MSSFLDGFSQGFNSAFGNTADLITAKRNREQQSEQFRLSHEADERERARVQTRWEMDHAATQAERDAAASRWQQQFAADEAERGRAQTRWEGEQGIRQGQFDIQKEEADYQRTRRPAQEAYQAAQTESESALGAQRRAETGKTEAETMGLRLNMNPMFQLQYNQMKQLDPTLTQEEFLNQLQGKGGETPAPAPETAIPSETPISPSAGEAAPELETRASEPQVQGAIPSEVTPVSAPAGGQGQVTEAQAGTRRLPLNDRTRTMLEQASAQTGLQVRVTSGAQPSSGPNRVGSHRHDVDVGSADLQLIGKNGKPVDMSTPEGQQQIIQFMQAARAAGATGFGAGPDYMGNTTIHVGFGSPGVWGAGGKGANAPQWLRTGMSGGGGATPSSVPSGKGVQPGLQGEKGTVERISGGERMPTPRGEVKNTVVRSRLMQGGVDAATVGAKAALQQAGMTGAGIPTQATDAQKRQYLTGDPSGIRAVNDMTATVQEALPDDVTMSDAERTLLTYKMVYDHALQTNPERAPAIMGELHNAYRAMVNQRMAFAKTLVQEGKLDQAGQMAAKAYSFIPNGKDAQFNVLEDGTFEITVTDMTTGQQSVQRQTPQEAAAAIMGWSPIDIDRQMVHKAGGASPEMQRVGEQMAAIPTQAELPPGQQVPEMRIADISQLDEKERGPYLTAMGQLAERVKTSREVVAGPTKPWTPSEREQIVQEIVGAMGEGFRGGSVPSEVVDPLRKAFAGSEQELQSTLVSLRETNPNILMPDIVHGVSKILTPMQGPDFQPRPTFSAQPDNERGVMVVQPAGTNMTLDMDPRTFIAVKDRAEMLSETAAQTARDTEATNAANIEQARQDAARTEAAIRAQTQGRSRANIVPQMAPRSGAGSEFAIPEIYRRITTPTLEQQRRNELLSRPPRSRAGMNR